MSRHRRCWLIFLLIPLVAVSVFLHAAKSLRHRKCVEAYKRYKWLPVEKPIGETKARRASFYQLRYFLAYPAQTSFAAADLARRINDIAPPLRLLAVEVHPALHELGFELTVGVEAVFQKRALRKLDAFLKRLANVPGIFDIASSPVPAPTGKDRMRVFIVIGHAELQP